MGSKVEMSMSTPLRNLHVSMTNHEARSGMQSPTLYTPAAVPFRWEEEPGKPWPCTAALVIVPALSEDFSVKSLELPPRMLNAAKMPPPPSGSLLLEGQRLQTFSFRMDRGSFGSSFRYLEGENSVCKRIMGTAWFGSWRRRRRRNTGNEYKEEIVGSRRYVFPSVKERECDWGFEGQENGRAMKRGRRRRRTSSFHIPSHPKSHFLRSIYQGLKRAFPSMIKKMGS